MAERTRLRAYAAKLRAGETLNPGEAMAAAAVLDEYAAGLPMHPPRRRGHSPELSPLHVATEFAFLTVVQGMGRTAAQQALADRAGVSLKAIKDALKQRGTALEGLYKQLDFSRWKAKRRKQMP